MPLKISDIAVPFRMLPGLRRLDPAEPMLTSLDGMTPLAQARHQSASHAFLSTPEFDRPSLEQQMRVVLTEHDLPQPPPEHFWPSLARTITEDLVFLDPHSGRVEALLVCCPSHWRPEHVVGLHFTQIHQGVAGNERLMHAAPHLLHILSGPQRWIRHVWSICPDAVWDRHPDRLQRAPWPSAADSAWPDQLTWRVEEQRFCALPELPLSMMSIRLQQTGLGTMLGSVADQIHLMNLLETMGPAIRRYKGLDPLLALMKSQPLTRAKA